MRIISNVLSRNQHGHSAKKVCLFIKANRFLRGMVRLIVGACLNAGLGKITLADLQQALEHQTILEHAWSVPAEGLYLHDVLYPEV